MDHAINELRADSPRQWWSCPFSVFRFQQDDSQPVDASINSFADTPGSPPIQNPKSKIQNSSPPPHSSRRTRSALGWFLLWLFVCVLFAVGQHDVLFSPPYWDSAMGLATEAEFLVQTDFDYPRLFFEEPRFLRGGSAIYLTSILPTTMALLRHATPDPAWAHFGYRIFSITCASAIVVGVFAWVRPRSGSLGAFLLSAALATTPVFLTQAELLGMEMPLAAMALLSGSLLTRRKYVCAAVAALACFFVKANGMLVIMAALTYLVIVGPLLWGPWIRSDKRRYFIGLGAVGVAFAIERGVTRWLQHLPNYEEITGFFDFRRGTEELWRCAQLCPDVAAIFVIAAVASFGYLGTRVRQAGGCIAGLRSIAEEDAVVLFSWILVAGILVSHAWTHVIPRYLVFPLVFIYIGLGRMALRWPPHRVWVNTALVLVVLANLWNVDGRWYPSLAGSDARTGAWLERSREYRADHQSNIAAVQAIVEHPELGPVVAPNPFVQFLSMPGLGYVQESIRGYAMNTTTNEFFQPVDSLRLADVDALIFVWVSNRFRHLAHAIAPTFDEGMDEVLYADSAQFPYSPLVVFVPRAAPNSGQTDRQTGLRRIWPWLDDLAEADHLAARGQLAEAIWRIEAQYRRYPPHQTAELRLKLGELYEQAGRTQDAVNVYTDVPVVPLYRARAMDRLSRLLAASGRAEQADFYRQQADQARWFFRENQM